MLELTVKTLDSQNHSFTVPDETTVRQLKESILAKIQVPVEIQRLIFYGKVLQDDKKLTDYGDVHGKVIHLVQRPPPPPSRPPNANNSETNQRTSSRRSHLHSRDRLDGGSSTYLGALAFSPDLMEAQGIQLPPSQRLSRRRLLVAQRMLNQAGACITTLENPEGPQSSSADSQEPHAASNSAQANASGSGREEADMFLGETTGSIARAAQAATAAAIAAAVSAAHAVVVPHITIRGASGQNDTPLSNLDNSNLNMSDINLNLNIDDNHPEDVAVEVEIGANSEVNVDECHEGDSIANNLDNNPSGSNVAPPRSNVERTSAFATLIEQLEEQQRRFQGVLRRCHQLMVDDPPLTENSSPNAEECQRLFNGVSETMHYFAHAYHALSDIMVDFNEDTPRTLRCRPVLIQQSAVLETIFPIQEQINLSTHRHTNESSSNLSSSESSQPSVNIMNGGSRVDVSNPENATGPAQTTAEPPQQEGGEENVTPHDSASSFSSTATQQSEERSQSSQSGSVNNTSGFFLSAPGNVEVFMDFRPESVTLGSVETTVILDNEARSRNNATGGSGGGGGIQLRNLGSGRTPIELLQSVQAVAGQLQNHLMRRMNQGAQGFNVNHLPPTYDINAQDTPSESVMSNPSATSQPHSSASTESTTPLTNVSTSRPYVHVGRAIPEIALNSYDPFLPCNSHHIMSHSRNQRRGGNSHGATARNTNEAGNATATPERANLIRVRPRQGTSSSATGPGAATANTSTSARTPRQSPLPGQPGFIPVTLRNFTQATLSNTPPMGWLMPGSPATSPGSMRGFLDIFLRSRSTGAAGGQNAMPRDRIAQFLSAIDSSYVEGDSIVNDFFITLARNLTWQDVTELSMDQRTMVESVVTRLHPALQAFVTQHLLQGEAPSEENIARACERIYSELKPYLDVLQQGARLRESVDLVATINNFNQSQIPEIVGLVVETPPSQAENFGQTMTRRVRNYFRQLVAIIIHCCQDGAQGFDAIVRTCVPKPEVTHSDWGELVRGRRKKSENLNYLFMSVGVTSFFYTKDPETGDYFGHGQALAALLHLHRLFTRGIPEHLQQWTEINSVNNLRYFTATLNVPLEDIQRYLVYRIPSSTTEKNEATGGSVPEPMETDASQNRNGWMQPEGMQSPEKVEEPMSDSLVDALDAENLPDVLIGSESWHNALPSEWVPIIARDSQRQRRQSSQKPFSDAYLSGLPPKRRKLITSAKPQGSLSQVISDGVRHAISAAGVNSTVAERAIAEAGKDDVLQEAYKEQERVVVSADLRKDPDFNPSRFPNAFKYFDK